MVGPSDSSTDVPYGAYDCTMWSNLSYVTPPFLARNFVISNFAATFKPFAQETDQSEKV